MLIMLHIIHLPSHIHITRSIALSLYLSFVDLHRLCFKSYTRWHAQMVLKIGNVVWLILPSKWAAWMYVWCMALIFLVFFPRYLYVCELSVFKHTQNPIEQCQWSQTSVACVSHVHCQNEQPSWGTAHAHLPEPFTCARQFQELFY